MSLLLKLVEQKDGMITNKPNTYHDRKISKPYFVQWLKFIVFTDFCVLVGEYKEYL